MPGSILGTGNTNTIYGPALQEFEKADNRQTM